MKVQRPPWEKSNSEIKSRAESWFIPGTNGYKTLVNPGAGATPLVVLRTA
jgi:hypothetical protein